jgi:hypothetical protein
MKCFLKADEVIPPHELPVYTQPELRRFDFLNGDVFASADVGYGRAYALDIVEA